MHVARVVQAHVFKRTPTEHGTRINFDITKGFARLRDTHGWRRIEKEMTSPACRHSKGSSRSTLHKGNSSSTMHALPDELSEHLAEHHTESPGPQPHNLTEPVRLPDGLSLPCASLHSLKPTERVTYAWGATYGMSRAAALLLNSTSCIDKLGGIRCAGKGVGKGCQYNGMGVGFHTHEDAAMGKQPTGIEPRPSLLTCS